MSTSGVRRAAAAASMAAVLATTGQVRAQNSGAAPGEAPRSVTPLEQIDVIGQMLRGWQGASDAVYETPSSVAQVGREAMDERGGARNTADLLRGVSGVNATIDRQNPGLNVNIRGLQDQGRVNMSIDGARQNFQQAGHGSTAYAYVDAELLSRVEIEKGPTSTAGGAGVIGGVANFRTLDPSDIIFGDKDWGARINATTGTNEFDFNGSAALAGRVSDAFEVVAAVGRKKLGEYEAGKRGDALKDNPVGSGSVFLPTSDYVTQDQWSWLLKAVAEPADGHKITLSYTGLETDFTTGSGEYIDTNTIQNHTATAAWRWTPGDPRIDLDAKLYYTRTSDDQFRPRPPLYPGATDGSAKVDYAIDTFGGSIQNTSRFDLRNVAVALTYGGEYFRDKTTTASVWVDPNRDPDNVQFSGPNPEGKRGVGGVFGQVDATYDWLQFIGGLRYDYFDLSGSGQMRDVASREFHPFKIDRLQGRLSPTATVAVKPLAGVQVYGSYKQGFRPPNIMETLIGGAHIGNILFFAPNPDLKPELAETWEAGVNLKFDGVLREDDAFRSKVAMYSTKLKNFISQGYNENNFVTYINLTEPAKLKGLDVEANYDAGDAYVGGSLSLIDGKYKSAREDGLLNLYLAPKTKAVLDGGVRFFERKLTVGGRVTHVTPEMMDIGFSASADYYARYTLFDAYASYKLNENFTIRAAVENITDRYYVDAMANQLTASPGRTATLGVTARF